MKLGVVGLPNVGKSTLFNAITKAGAEAANYPFCTIEPNTGMVAVPEGQPKIGHRSDSVGFRETLPFPWHGLGVRNLALWVRVVSGWHLELRLLSSCGEFCFTYKNV